MFATTAYREIDIWTQPESLLRIQEADVEEDSPLRQYEWKEGVLWKTFPNGIKVQVPPPNERDAIIRDVHEKQGHLGRSRTYQIVSMQYWWACIYKDSMRVVSQCRDCDRAKNSPVMRHDVLHPLTIQPLLFRFHMDTCPKLPCTTRQGNTTCFIIMEAFSKALFLIPVQRATAAAAAKAFRNTVLAQFGAPAEVVTDNGSEFQAKFKEMLMEQGIKPRHSSHDHPQANGAAKRLVKGFKLSLQVYCCEEKVALNWDEKTPQIQPAYNITIHTST